MILAKPVVPDQYWILRDADNKIGNIMADNNGFAVKIGGHVEYFKTLDMLQQRMPIQFEDNYQCTEVVDTATAYGYPTRSRPYNAIWDVRRQPPIWTRDERSKSWYAAGWFKVQQHSKWKVVLCPKTITLDRYKYLGPFFTKVEAESA